MGAQVRLRWRAHQITETRVKLTDQVSLPKDATIPMTAGSLYGVEDTTDPDQRASR